VKRIISKVDCIRPQCIRGSSDNAACASPYRVAGSDVEQMVKFLRLVPGDGCRSLRRLSIWRVEERRREEKKRRGLQLKSITVDYSN
jgi:hypothetical protein